MSIKSILVSQPEPKTDKNPFSDLAERFNLKVDFRSFIHVEGIDPQDFRQQRINLTIILQLFLLREWQLTIFSELLKKHVLLFQTT